MFDPITYQADFPILQKPIHNTKRLVYLDNGATSQKPLQVINAISDYYKNHNANVHRGIHQLGDESTKLFHTSRQTIANFFGANAEELVVVRNTTEAINQVVYTWGEASIVQDDIIITTELEHHSNIVPWQQLASRKNAHLLFVDVDDTGRLDVEQLLSLVKKHGSAIKLIALTHVSNALGTVTPVAEIIQEVKKLQPQIVFLIDGAQAAPHFTVNFQQLNAEFYVVSAHKMLGPMGIGGLFIKKEVLNTLSPFLFGGGMIQEVSQQETSFAEDLEERFAAGTPDVAGLVGWAAACEYLTAIGMGELLKHDKELVDYTLEALQKFSQIKIVGPVQPLADGQQLDRVGSVAFLYQGVHAHDVGQILDSEGVAVRSGHHCTMPLHTKFHWPATVRVSFQLYNSKEDITALVSALEKVHQIFKR
jgi:cysteine desulfurase / selenocysteine lyase